MIGLSAPRICLDDQRRAFTAITREWKTEEIPLIAKKKQVKQTCELRQKI